MAMTRQIWSISAAAVELCRDRRTIAAALRDTPTDGKINAKTSGYWLRTILDAMASGGDGGDLDLNAERARKAKEEADRLEMQNAQMRRDLLPRADVDAAVTGAFARVRARLLAIPSSVAPLVVSADLAQASQAIEGAIAEALNELSGTNVAELCGDDDGMVGDTEAAAASDREPVG